MRGREVVWVDDKNVRSSAQMREYSSFADRICADLPGGEILDWGAAFGQMSQLMAERGLRVTAFDYDPDVEQETVRPLPLYPDLDVLVTNETVTLPYPDARFDGVLSSGVLEHVRDPEASLSELARILKPGGVLYVYKLPNSYSYLEWLARRLGMYFHGKYPDDRLYTVSTARALLRDNGYQVQEIRLANMLPLSVFTGKIGDVLAGPVWLLNRLLARLPLVNRLATNVELTAVPTGLRPNVG